MLANPAGLSKVSNSYDKFRQTAGENDSKRRLFSRKFGPEPVAAILGRPLIVRPHLEI
jgi:hypothetical protein